ncbi:ankyrin repeat domain-containing protein 9 [Ictalurus punctatus]|uniref:Ankyrin repeat domain-containing protein 9 n=1 Tax=Ictalurus punctatus TaxID=7998 RepID=A0A2D0RK91_ICTPU|nr:ankyrin repeat domain-containing protein 9 [Ictalurus punctatus]
MPLDLGMYERRPDYKSEKQCQRTSLAFYQAVRDLLPVWLLEDIRTTEAFHWEDEGRACAFSPSEALLYALVHDHQQYARHLLQRFPVHALAVPSASFRCCAHSAAPHVAVAVRYNRTNILKMMMGSLKDFADEGEKQLLLNHRGCAHAEGGKTVLHLACDLARPECLLLLLGHGACPYVTDRAGDTPLDCLLQQISQSDMDMRTKRVCLGYMVLFMPALRFRMRAELRENPALWSRLIGEQAFQWLSGQCPTSLFVQCMRTVTRSVPDEQLESLPDFLRPPDFRLHQS